MGHIVRFCVCACMCLSTISVQNLASVVNFVCFRVQEFPETGEQTSSVRNLSHIFMLHRNFFRNRGGEARSRLLKWTLSAK